MSRSIFDIAHLQKYINGELSSREMHEIERAAHEDEMLMDVLMGMETEKDQNATPTALIDIRKQITQRVQQNTITKPLWSNRSVQMAASLIFLITATTVLFWNQQGNVSQKDEPLIANKNKVFTGPSHERIAEIAASADSTNQTFVNTSSAPPQRKNSERVQAEDHSSTSNRSLTAHEKHILAYTTEEKNVELSQEVTGSLNLGQPKHESDVIIINTESQDSRPYILASSQKKQVQSTIVDTRVSANPNAPLSSAQMRNRLSNLGLEPQTNFMSVQVIDKQSRQPLAGATVKDLQNDNVTVTDEEGRFTYAANSKKNLKIGIIGYNERDISTEDREQTIVLSPKVNRLDEVTANSVSKMSTKISRSTPSIGWGKYMAYLREELEKKTKDNYTFNIQMELDKKGAPTQVSILQSSDKTLNAKVVSILKQGPIWKRGTDWKNIYLQIKSL